ncbi:hypothetical protein [Roseobacter sp. CCS2]|uniref:hypothetical protein n=1 Tax=Roseobacter sp. CCS2 TaxID=391593 RepID=UPI0000F3E599|nr:hypothetical protein [Roseobacter sp. CCS2]EBA10955.1 hypothetical protein RCCS2_00699 [Roseobacter sp. CCS2]
MDKATKRRGTQLRAQADADFDEKTLVIGNLARWNAEGRQTASSAHIQFSELRALTKTTLDDLSPSVILSPLMGDDFDVLDVAMRLVTFGYDGRYRAITENLPDAEMIRKEVRAHAPDLDFDILVMPPVANDNRIITD